MTSQVLGNNMPSTKSRRLVIGVALNDFELISAAEDTKGQHPRSVDHFTGDIDRHEPDDLPAGFSGLPIPGGSKI